MADGVDIDLYADDLEQDFAQVIKNYISIRTKWIIYFLKAS